MIRAQNKSKTYYVYFDSTKPVGTLKDEYRFGNHPGSYTKSVVFPILLRTAEAASRHCNTRRRVRAHGKHIRREQRSRQLRPTAGIISAHRTRADYIRTRVRFVLIQASPREHYTAEQKAAASGSTVTSQLCENLQPQTVCPVYRKCM